jgi:DNA invertase Pin-like site-specific DNA recombinase
MVQIGYMRVSKGDGPPQQAALIQAGVAPDAIYQDRLSGASDKHHPALNACLRALQETDTLIVWKLNRLGPSLPQLVQTIHTLEKRGVGLRVLTGTHMDTTTPSGKMIFSLFTMLADFEQELFLGPVNRGRPSTMTRAKLDRAVEALANGDTNGRSLAAELGITLPTLYRYVAPSGELRPHGQRVREIDV